MSYEIVKIDGKELAQNESEEFICLHCEDVTHEDDLSEKGLCYHCGRDDHESEKYDHKRDMSW